MIYMQSVITGTSQGLGAQLVKVLAPKADQLISINRRPAGNEPEILCDLASRDEVLRASNELRAKLIQGDVLFVLNAGEYGEDETLSDVTPETLGQLMYTNVFGQLALVESLLKSGHKVRLVALSSSMGSISSSDEPYHYAYSASKAALNLCVRLLRHQYKTLDYLLINPGWMKTRMGGDSAPVDPADTAAFIIAAIDDPARWNNSNGMVRAPGGGLTLW